MKRFPSVPVGLATLGLMLTACVPIDAIPAEPSNTPAAEAEPALPHFASPPPVAASTVPLRPYVADGLAGRINNLRKSSDAYRVQQGQHPIDDAVPGTEEVLLAEDFSSNHRFDLPEKQTGDRINLNVTCSRSANITIDVFGANGESLGSGSASECGPDHHIGIGLGSFEDQRVRQVQVASSHETDLELSVITFTGRPID